MIDDVQSVGFLLCLRLCGEDREDGFSGCFQEIISPCSCRFENRSSRDRIGRLHAREYVVAIVKKLYHAFAGVAWVELADEDPLNAFLDEKDGIVRVLPMFVCLQGQFVYPFEDLLLRGGPCHVARFRHGGVC